MSLDLAHSTRPITVTIAVVVGWISVVLDVVAGIGLYLLAGNEELLGSIGASASTATAAAIGVLIGAAILAIVVTLLARGSGMARVLVSGVMVLRMGVAVWTLVAFGSHNLTEALVSIVIASVALWLLWNARASEFFARN